jgi:hypothetical protein
MHAPHGTVPTDKKNVNNVHVTGWQNVYNHPWGWSGPSFLLQIEVRGTY